MVVVNFEIAKKLKEKGFKQGFNIFGYKLIFSDENTIKYISDIGAYEKEDFGINIPCPSISQVLKCLRDEHNLYVCPTLNTYRGKRKKDKAYNLWMFQVKNIANNHLIYPHPLDMHDVYETYEQAAHAGIEYVLDNLI